LNADSQPQKLLRRGRPRGRPRGQPGPLASPNVRQDILKTAERLFAMQGFSATAIREIAADVGVNPAMVHYYFGSKKELLMAVMEAVLEPLAGSVEALRQRDQINISDFTALLFAVMTEHPFLPQLIAREIFLPGGKFQSQFLEMFAPRLGGRLPGILSAEQKKGRLSPALDPDVTALMILSMCFFPFIARPAAEQALHIDYTRAGMKIISQHIVAILEGGIRV